MSPGTGKTLTGLWIREEMKSGRTLILFPSLSLLSQTLKVWTAQSKSELKWICVCSDQTVGKDQKNNDEWIVNLSELGIPVTNDSKDIEEFINEYPDGVVFSTYQSSPLIQDVYLNESIPSFDLTICDEAHRCAGKVSTQYGVILDEDKIRSRKRLFMTGTPRILSSRIKKKAGEENIQVVSMDDKSVFGEVFHTLSFSQAIEKELLCDYKVIVVGVDDPMLQSDISSKVGIQTTSEYKIDSEKLSHHVGLSKAIKDYSLNRVITFHNRTKNSRLFSSTHAGIVNSLPASARTSNEILTGFVQGDMSSSLRNKELDKLRDVEEGQVAILSNARCLSEGVDVPSLDAVAFIDPRQSIVDIVQSVGRVMRVSEGKEYGYIILPLYLDCPEELDEKILESKFEPIWKVLLALKSQDDLMSDLLDDLRVLKSREGNSAILNSTIFGEKIVFDIPDDIASRFSDSITTYLVDNTTENWLQMYGELIAYQDQYGDTLVPNKAGQRVLARWVSTQRVYFNNGTLNQERIDLLNKINFTWSVEDSQWNERFQNYKTFVEENGSQPFATHKEFGDWMKHQRKLKKSGKLSSERIDLLDQVGISWGGLEDKWQQNYQLLIDYKSKHGTVVVPRKVPILGTWVVSQRDARKNGRISDRRIKLLDAIGFVWVTRDSAWDEKCQEYCELVKKNNGSHIIPNTRETEKIRKWVGSQRTYYKNTVDGKTTRILTQDKIDMLESIDGWMWNLRPGYKRKN